VVRCRGQKFPAPKKLPWKQMLSSHCSTMGNYTIYYYYYYYY